MDPWGSWLVSKIDLSGPRSLRDPAFKKKKKELGSAWGILEGCPRASTFTFTPAHLGKMASFLCIPSSECHCRYYTQPSVWHGSATLQTPVERLDDKKLKGQLGDEEI